MCSRKSVRQKLTSYDAFTTRRDYDSGELHLYSGESKSDRLDGSDISLVVAPTDGYIGCPGLLKILLTKAAGLKHASKVAGQEQRLQGFMVFKFMATDDRKTLEALGIKGFATNPDEPVVPFTAWNVMLDKRIKNQREWLARK